MKPSFGSCCLGLLAVLWPVAVHGALSQPHSLVGKFLVSGVNGSVTCSSEGRVFELKKDDTVTARGAVVTSAPKANAILVFSNGTGVYADEKTRFEIEKFDQEFFAPNNNLRVEPSNSWTVVKLRSGRLVISTPRLLSGTSMTYETAHAAVEIRGDKILIETDEKQTHVAMIAGTATVNPRDAEGRFVSIGKRLVTGQEAFVKFTARGESEETAAAPEPGPTGGATGATPAGPASKEVKPRAAAPTAERGAGLAEAKLLQLRGGVHLLDAETGTGRVAAAGARLRTGAVISTAADGEAFVQAYPGAIAVVQPGSVVALADLAITMRNGAPVKQSVVLELRAGGVVSAIDPAKKTVDEYAIRTPQGTASAQGTSFFTSVGPDGLRVGTTADTVSFVTPSGNRFEISAGTVSMTPAAGESRVPVPLAAAAAADPGFGAAVLGAFDAVATIVQNRLGGISASSAASLLARVAASAAGALPPRLPPLWRGPCLRPVAHPPPSPR